MSNFTAVPPAVLFLRNAKITDVMLALGICETNNGAYSICDGVNVFMVGTPGNADAVDIVGTSDLGGAVIATMQDPHAAATAAKYAGAHGALRLVDRRPFLGPGATDGLIFGVREVTPMGKLAEPLFVDRRPLDKTVTFRLAIPDGELCGQKHIAFGDAIGDTIGEICVECVFDARFLSLKTEHLKEFVIHNFGVVYSVVVVGNDGSRGVLISKGMSLQMKYVWGTQ